MKLRALTPVHALHHFQEGMRGKDRKFYIGSTSIAHFGGKQEKLRRAKHGENTAAGAGETKIVVT